MPDADRARHPRRSTGPARSPRSAACRSTSAAPGRSSRVIIVATFGPQISRSRPDLGLRAYLVAAAFSVLLLVSVLAHEAAHAVVATRFGYRVNRVVADLWGGHTAYDTAQSRPGPSALVAVAGPAANGVIAALGWLPGRPVPAACRRCWSARSCGPTPSSRCSTCCPACRWTAAFLVDALRLAGHRQPRPRPRRGRMVRSGRRPCSCSRGRCCCRSCSGYPPSLFTVVWAGVIGAFLWAGADATPSAPAAPGPRSRRSPSPPYGAAPARCRPPAAPRTPGRCAPAVSAARAVVVVADDGTAPGLVDDDALLRHPRGGRRAHASHGRRPPAARGVGRRRRPRRPGHHGGGDDADAAGRRGPGRARPRAGSRASSSPTTSRRRCHEGPPRAPRLARHERAARRQPDADQADETLAGATRPAARAPAPRPGHRRPRPAAPRRPVRGDAALPGGRAGPADRPQGTPAHHHPDGRASSSTPTAATWPTTS